MPFMQTTGLTYVEWNQAIGNFCFQVKNEGKPIRFSIDPLILQEASQNLKKTEVFKTPEDAASDFVETVVQKMRGDLTDPWWFLDGTRNTKPKHLAKLGIQVLAVFYMKPSEEGDSSYWESLRKLVGVVDPNVGLGGWGHKRFSEYQANWKKLRCWCNDICEGKYGKLPDEDNLKGYKHVKIPLAHGLLRQEDIQKLPQFFKKVGFRADWELGLNELRKKIHAHKDQMEYFPSPHCRRVLCEAERFEGAVRQIHYAFKQWDGSDQVELSKDRRDRVRLVFYFSGSRLDETELNNLAGNRSRGKPKIENGRICSIQDYSPFDSELLIAKKEARGYTEINLFRRGDELAIACPIEMCKRIEPSLKRIAKEGKLIEVASITPFEGWKIVKLQVKKNLIKKKIKCEQLRERFKSPKIRIQLIGGLRFQKKWIEGVGPTIRIKRKGLTKVLVDEIPVPIENGVLSPEICPSLNMVGKHEISIEETKIRKSFEVFRPVPEQQVSSDKNLGWGRSVIDLWPLESDCTSDEKIVGAKIVGYWPKVLTENRSAYPIEVLWSRLVTILRIGAIHAFDKETKKLIREASSHSNLLIKQIAQMIQLRFRGRV